MEILTFELPPIGTNAYLLMAPGRKDAVLVDAPPEALVSIGPHLAKAGRKLAAVLLTHGHWDHMADAAAWQKQGAKVYAHAADKVLIETPMIQADYMIPELVIEPATIDEYLTQGQVLEIAGLRFEVRHVPGHAPGNVLFYSAEDKAAFVGDVIFAGSVGRSDLPGGDGKVLKKSILEQVYTLPNDTVIYPGHGPETTVGQERLTNMFVRG